MERGIRGLTTQCFAHWKSRIHDPNRAADRMLAWKKVAARSTVKAWITTGPLPEGERLLRLQAFLIHEGYQPLELEHQTISLDVRNLRLAIGEQRISLAEATKRIGYRKSQHLLEVLEGRNPNKHFRRKIASLARAVATKTSAPVVSTERAETQPSGIRKIVEHVITILHSSANLLIANGITPEQVFDGDRMNIERSLRRLAPALGLEIAFHRGPMLGEPLTQADLIPPTKAARSRT